MLCRGVCICKCTLHFAVLRRVHVQMHKQVHMQLRLHMRMHMHMHMPVHARCALQDLHIMCVGARMFTCVCMRIAEHTPFLQETSVIAHTHNGDLVWRKGDVALWRGGKKGNASSTAPEYFHGEVHAVTYETYNSQKLTFIAVS